MSDESDRCEACGEIYDSDEYWEHQGQQIRNAEIDASVKVLATLSHNLATAAFGALMFKAGDNFGFHMGADETQCTCQWSPNIHGEPYRPMNRCEQDDYDDHWDCEQCTGYSSHDDGLDAEWPDNLPVEGPNGCVCGFNGDCNCPFKESTPPPARGVGDE